MKKNKQMVVRVENNLKNKFEQHCQKNGYSISKRLRILIENDIQRFDNTKSDGYSL